MILNAILPIFILILFGYLLKRLSIVDDSFWFGAEQLTYYIFFPALLISKMSVTELSGLNLNSTILACLISLFVIILINYVLRKLFNISDFSFGAFFQGTIRFNTYIGLALVSNLFDENGLTISIIIAAIMIPLVNICSVTILQIHQEKNPNEANNTLAQNVYKNLYNLIKNPLILGCAIGILMNYFSIQLPTAIFDSVKILGSLALPLGLMTVGATLVLRNINEVFLPIALSSLLKLFLLPIIGLSVAKLIGLETLTTQILVIFLALPTATASYILTKKMQSNHQLMARLITLQTLFSSLTLIVILNLLSSAL